MALGIPIGLIATDYGGTAIEGWSSPQALAQCAHDAPSPTPDSSLWNAMVVPVLSTVIKGAIWCVGDAMSIM